METQPIDTAKVYALTAAGACSVTLTQGEKSITWEALEEGGQTSFIVPAGATVSISDSTALLSPLPANFKAALGAGTARIGGERIIPETVNEHGFCEIRMLHRKWHTLPPETVGCTISPSKVSGSSRSAVLVLTPTEELKEGWLCLNDGTPVLWLYGEPAILSGHTYLIGLTQIEPDKVLANLLTTY